MSAFTISEGAEFIGIFLGSGMLGYSIGFCIVWFKKFSESST